jgi:outer membrane protein
MRMQVLRMALVTALAAMPSGDAWAQRSLRLMDAVDAALASHPSAQAGEAGVSGAAAAAREAGAARLPAAAVDGAVTRYQEPMVVAPLHGFDPLQPPVFDRTLVQGSMALSYLLFDGGGRSARVARASAQRESAVARREALSQALIADVVRRYAAVLIARDLEAAHRSRVDALEQERDRAGRLLAEGRAARVVLLRAEAALSAARAELVGTAAQATAAERDLARVMGVAAAAVTEATLEPAAIRAAVPGRDEAVSQALGSNPELERLAAERAARAAGVVEAGAQWWPRLQLGGRYVRYASGAGDVGGEWQTGVQLSYPLFTGGARPAAADRARAEARMADAELRLGELRVADGVDRALVALEAAQSRTTAWRSAVEQSEEVVRIERLSLDTGGGVQTDYLNAEAELLRARAALTEARYTEVVARVELARSLGTLTRDGLAATLEVEP